MPNTFTLIASSTVGAGGASSIDFSSIPSTYTDLSLLVSARVASGGGQANNIYLRFNGDTGANYSFKALEAYSGTSVQSYGGTSQTKALFGGSTTDATTANTFGSVAIYIPNYAGSSAKSISGDTVAEYNSSTQGTLDLLADLWSGTSAINSINITSNANFAQYTTAYLYGIKNS